MSAEPVAVIGAGTMGHGIAQVCAMAGFEVRLHDRDPARLERAAERIRENLATGVARGKVTSEIHSLALANLRTADTLEAAVTSALLVIEAVPEQLALKRSLFERLDSVAPPPALLATNTSSLSVSSLAEATRRPAQVLGLHFFNPVHLMRLLEVVRGRHTAPETIERALAFARRIGKEPIVVADRPGFASSRLGVALGLEAMRMLEEGVASAEDIDTAMVLGYNHPLGPLRLSDLIGLDVRLEISSYLHHSLAAEHFRPPEILRRLVADGKLGRKTGHGFYLWDQA